jgi:hypothetical protein
MTSVGLRSPAAALLLLSLAASAAASSSAAPCIGRFNQTVPFEEVCYKVLFNGTEALQLREYVAGAGAAATLVTYNASNEITVYQEALEMTAFYVIDYFIGPSNALNKSILTARTVPFALRPPTAHNAGWLGFMAAAPSKYPPGSAPPKPLDDIELAPLGGSGGKEALLLAVQGAVLYSTPQPSDFDTLCASLRSGVAKQLPGYTVDETSIYTPTHARFYGMNFFGGTFEVECWVGVKKA